MHHRLVKSSGARGSLPFDSVVTLSQKAVERSGEARPGHRTGINPPIRAGRIALECTFHSSAEAEAKLAGMAASTAVSSAGRRHRRTIETRLAAGMRSDSCVRIEIWSNTIPI
jgi:hypothetical protein